MAQSIRDRLGNPSLLGVNLLEWAEHLDGFYPDAMVRVVREVGDKITHAQLPARTDAAAVMKMLDDASVWGLNAVLASTFQDWAEEVMGL